MELCLLKKSIGIMIVEENEEWKSKDYQHYKPYKEPPKNYDWRDYCTLNDDGTKIISCHHCDIRKNGCLTPSTPRYYCKKDKRERQSNLLEW